jgi:ELWxxDGT repeat protein
VKDINPTTQRGGSSFPIELTNVGGTLFFTADDGVHGWELWKSNGTTADTVLVKDIKPSGGSLPLGSLPLELTNVGGTLFLVADDDVHGVELWKSNGTPAGTVLVRDIWPQGGHSFPRDLTLVE